LGVVGGCVVIALAVVLYIFFLSKKIAQQDGKKGNSTEMKNKFNAKLEQIAI